jgi:hypothetical protein
MTLNIRQNSRLAFFVMLLMIIAGTLIGSHNSLQAMRESAAVVFTAGLQGNGLSIQGDLNERASAAYNMTVVARKYLPEDNAAIRRALAAREELLAAASIKEKARANQALEEAVKDLYEILNAVKLSAQDERYPQKIYTEFQSRGDTISHDPYNQTAAEFNGKLSAFPANVLGGLTGVKSLELFQ